MNRSREPDVGMTESLRVSRVDVCASDTLAAGPADRRMLMTRENRSERRASGIPDASVVAERANTPPGKLGGDLITRDGHAEDTFSKTCFEGHTFLPAATALRAELSLCSD